MPNISQINVGGSVYQLKDADAQERVGDLKSAFITSVGEQDYQKTVNTGNNEYTSRSASEIEVSAKSGDVVILSFSGTAIKENSPGRLYYLPSVGSWAYIDIANINNNTEFVLPSDIIGLGFTGGTLNKQSQLTGDFRILNMQEGLWSETKKLWSETNRANEVADEHSEIFGLNNFYKGSYNNGNNIYIGSGTTKKILTASKYDIVKMSFSGTALNSSSTVLLYLEINGSYSSTGIYLDLAKENTYILPDDITAIGFNFGNLTVQGQANVSVNIYNHDNGLIYKVQDLESQTNSNTSRIEGLESLNDTIISIYASGTHGYIGKNNTINIIPLYPTDRVIISIYGDAVTSETTAKLYKLATSESEPTYVQDFDRLDGFSYDLTESIAGISFNIGSIQNNKTVKVSIKIESYDIPTYWKTYIQPKIDRLNQLAVGCVANGDFFGFITDEHWELNQKKSPELLKILNDKCYFNRLFSGGDTADIVSKPFCDALRIHYPHNIHHVIGNHDVMGDGTSSKTYYYMDSFNNNQIGNAYEHYYYVENPQMKIRYIVLAAYRHTSTGTNIENGYTQEQVTWLNNEALNVPNGWSVIVLTHDAVGYSEGWVAIKSALDDAKENGKDVICIVSGHAHYDAINHTTGGIPIIVTTCDKSGAWIDSQHVDREPWLTEYRIPGTTSEQAFDMIFIDRANKEITCVRIGALAMNNVDKTPQMAGFTYVGTLEERTVSYV